MFEMITVLLGLDRQLFPAEGTDSVHCVWVQRQQRAAKCFPQSNMVHHFKNIRWRH